MGRRTLSTLLLALLTQAAVVALAIFLPLRAEAISRPCWHMKATIVGTSQADVLRGTSGLDVIEGLGGPDVIRGMGGDDYICGGLRADLILGGRGSDHIQGDLGADFLIGRMGSDTLKGNENGDDMRGDRGNDRVVGGPGVDWVRGGSGSDDLSSIDGVDGDTVNGGAGGDTCEGDSGDEVINCALAQEGTDRTFRGSFVTSCRYSHSVKDDPIIFPGQPGASHRHDFFGSKSTRAASTLRRMREGGTKCRLLSDTAGYWSPTAYLAGHRIKPDRVRAYYFGLKDTPVETIPVGLRILAGNKDARTPEDNPHVRWFCGASKRHGAATPTSGHPYDCGPYLAEDPFVDGIVAKVDFPICWDGTGLNPEDVVYEVAPRVCPLGYPHLLPRVILRFHFGIMDPCLGKTPCGPDQPDANLAVTLSSGTYVTFHADFWNTWHQQRLDHFVEVCLVSHESCGGLVSGRLK
jgi:Domain of unknown function (DUF1996)/RTX calcium-binding nonapeptide repeat (4 copies)